MHVTLEHFFVSPYCFMIAWTADPPLICFHRIALVYSCKDFSDPTDRSCWQCHFDATAHRDAGPQIDLMLL